MSTVILSGAKRSRRIGGEGVGPVTLDSLDRLGMIVGLLIASAA
jgi:hypothetical protein